MNRRNQTTWFLMHLVPVCSEEQTKTRTLPLLLGWLQRPLLLLERIVVEELLPVQRGESQPVYFDCSEAEKVHKGAKVFLNSYFRLTTLWFHEKFTKLLIWCCCFELHLEFKKISWNCCDTRIWNWLWPHFSGVGGVVIASKGLVLCVGS